MYEPLIFQNLNTILSLLLKKSFLSMSKAVLSTCKRILIDFLLVVRDKILAMINNLLLF